VGRMGAMGATAGPAVDAARAGPQVATVGAVATWGGAGLLAGVGLVHLVTAPGYFEYARYLGLLFLANAAGAAVAALGLLGVVGLGAIRVPRAWGWGLGLLVAGGAFAAYVASNTVGLPGLTEQNWLDPLGLLSLALEGAFVVLALLVLRPRRPAAAAVAVRRPARGGEHPA
jgi:hypothetical protein